MPSSHVSILRNHDSPEIVVPRAAVDTALRLNQIRLQLFRDAQLGHLYHVASQVTFHEDDSLRSVEFEPGSTFRIRSIDRPIPLGDVLRRVALTASTLETGQQAHIALEEAYRAQWMAQHQEAPPLFPAPSTRIRRLLTDPAMWEQARPHLTHHVGNLWYNSSAVPQDVGGTATHIFTVQPNEAFFALANTQEQQGWPSDNRDGLTEVQLALIRAVLANCQDIHLNEGDTAAIQFNVARTADLHRGPMILAWVQTAPVSPPEGPSRSRYDLLMDDQDPLTS